MLVVEWDGAGPSIARTLAGAGREVHTAADPAQARAVLAGRRADCLVLDASGLARWGFPEVRDTLAAAAGAGVPVVLASAADPEDLRALAARLGAAGAVRRPVAPVELLRAVDAAERV